MFTKTLQALSHHLSALFSRLRPAKDRERNDPENESMTEGVELKRVVALADQLAERIITELENRVLTIEEFGTSREVALVAEVGAMLQDAGLELPPGIHRHDADFLKAEGAESA